jgi:hypothetical protein
MAVKYQTFSLIYTVGDVGEVPSNPNSVVPLQYGPSGEKPEIGTIKPELDVDKILSLVSNVLAMLLSTKNLAAPTINNSFTVDQAASGISKLIDQSESVEDRKDQETFFRKAEQDLWWFIKEKGIPYWRAKNMLVDDLNREFSSEFDMTIAFKEPKVLISEKEQIELSALRLENGFSTLKRELAILHPQLSGDEIEELSEEIIEERHMATQAQLEFVNGDEDADRSDNESEVQSEVPRKPD